MFYYLNYVERKMALKTHVVITGENLLIFSLGRFSNSSREAGNATEKLRRQDVNNIRKDSSNIEPTR